MVFKMLRRFFTGEVLYTTEIPVSSGYVRWRLKLKRERATGDLYVVMSMSSTGHSDYQYLDADNFRQLVETVQDMQAAMDHAASKRITAYI